MTKYGDTLEKKRLNYQSRKHPCSVCGDPCNAHSILCKDCHKKDGKGVKRAEKWREEHRHPCRICGKPCDHRSEICIRCYRKPEYMSDKYCKKCGAVLGIKNKTGFCKKCHIRDAVYNWKGGRRVDRKGYIYIKCRGHHRATKNNFVCEHILVWEEAHNKPLPDGWVIHHLNGIPADNRPRNLEAMPKGKHHSWLVQQAMAKRIQELEGLLNGQSQLL